MGAFDVSENIAFDGSSYYCKRCGKAGYLRATQVRGHLAMCPGTLARKGIAPTTSSNQLQPVATGIDGGLTSSQLPVVEVVVEPGNNQPVGPSGNSQLLGYMQQIDRRVATMENEYNHVVRQTNLPPQENWLTKNLALVILGGILLFSLLSSMSRSQQCPSGSSENSSSGPNFKKLTERVVNKVADTAITKSIGKVFA